VALFARNAPLPMMTTIRPAASRASAMRAGTVFIQPGGHRRLVSAVVIADYHGR